jgi:hypothetical protein
MPDSLTWLSIWLSRSRLQDWKRSLLKAEEWIVRRRITRQALLQCLKARLNMCGCQLKR